MTRRRSAVRTYRRRSGLALLGLATAAAVSVAGIVLGGPAAQAAGPVPVFVAGAPATGTTSTAVTTGDHSLSVTVTPYSGLAPSGAQLTVTGSGFDPANDLWVAVCQVDGVAPAALLHCVGGAIPDDNSTTGWGIVTQPGKPPYPGPVIAHWKDTGSFSLALQLPAVIGESVDCVAAPCAVYTRSADDNDRTEDVAVPVSFQAPPATTTSSSTSGAPTTTTSTSATSTSPTTTAEPSTQTLGPVATTVTPDSMLQTSLAVGASQTVVFTGFAPDEQVKVTLFSEPVALPPVTADPGGNVRIAFDVPATIAPGEHLLQAVGQKSGRVGIARFTVVPAAGATSGSVSTTAASSTVSPSTVSQSVSSAASTVSSASVATSTVASATTSPSVTTSGSAVAAPGAAGNGNRLLWLWIALAVLVIVGAAAGAVAMVRNRRDDEDDVPVVAAGAPLPPAPGWGAAGAPPPEPPQREPDGAFGLLSGRDHPDGPGLYGGGAWPEEGPTQVLGGAQGGGQPGGPAGGRTGEQPTQQWRPEFTGQNPPGQPDPGPSTQQWRPDFTGQNPPADPDAGPDGRPPGR